MFHQSASNISKITWQVFQSKSNLLGTSASTGIVRKIQMIETRVYNSIESQESKAETSTDESVLHLLFPYIQDYQMAKNASESYILLGAPGLIRLIPYLSEFDVDVTHNVIRFNNENIHQFSIAALLPTGATSLVRVLIWNQTSDTFENIFTIINKHLEKEFQLDWKWNSKGFNTAYMENENTTNKAKRFLSLINDSDQLVDTDEYTHINGVDTIHFDFNDATLRGLENFLLKKYGESHGADFSIYYFKRRMFSPLL